MGYTRTFIERSWILLLPAIVLILAVAVAKGQGSSSGSTQKLEQVATTGNVKPSSAKETNVPVFKEYHGVTIGMSADEVRSKIDRLKESERQDLLVLSNKESAQIYYDDKGKVMAVSIDYLDESLAPAPESVLGTTITANENGSMYQLKRYPEAGYWVSYNRTRGDKPIVTITMQRM
jgi:hypothetical protein